MVNVRFETEAAVASAHFLLSRVTQYLPGQVLLGRGVWVPVERHPDDAARRRVPLQGVDALKLTTPGCDFKADFGAGRIVLGSTAIVHIQGLGMQATRPPAST